MIHIVKQCNSKVSKTYLFRYGMPCGRTEFGLDHKTFFELKTAIIGIF